VTHDIIQASPIFTDIVVETVVSATMTDTYDINGGSVSPLPDGTMTFLTTTTTISNVTGAVVSFGTKDLDVAVVFYDRFFMLGWMVVGMLMVM
jgi:hypothetical protein